jgi:hypothetical protein
MSVSRAQSARPQAAALARPDVVTFSSLEALKAFVQTELCRLNGWDRAASALLAAPLVRAGRPCGLLLRAIGPKRQSAHAIWSEAERRLLLYDTAGRRAREVRLSEPPHRAPAPAHSFTLTPAKGE